MPCIFPKFILFMTKLFPIYYSDMTNNCPWYPEDIPNKYMVYIWYERNIFRINAQDMPQKYPKYNQDTQNVCTKYPQNICPSNSKICQIHAPYTPETCLRYEWDIIVCYSL